MLYWRLNIDEISPFIVVMSVLWMYRPSYALLKIGFVDIFPTVRVTSRNFKVESIDRLFYTQYHLSPKAFVVGIDYQIVGIHFRSTRLYAQSRGRIL